MPPPTRLPAGRQLTLTWAIPPDFGGLTIALLRRSRAFSELGGIDVGVLTLDPRENRVERDRLLTERGLQVPGVTVTNLYDWLRDHPLPGGSLRPNRDRFEPLAHETTLVERDLVERDLVDGPARRRVRTGPSGAVRQIDHLRADGSLVLSDRRLGGGRRAVVLCDRAGAPVRSWRDIGHLYAAWLDALTAGHPSFLLVDSKAAARFAVTYRRRSVTTVHVVHGSHRGADGVGVRDSRREVFGRLHDFDATVFATRAQRRDVRRLAGPVPHLATVPHALPPASVVAPAPRAGAAVVARLVPLKRVEDAVRGVQQANRVLTEPIALEVYGDGPAAASLREVAAGDDAIRFHGFVGNVSERLGAASLLLLTSRSEAFGFAIGEAMAAGCLPVSYDIAYGPSDLIDHGRNGWLVPAGDVDALADAVVAASRLPAAETERMRHRARERAAEYTDERIVAIWARTLRRARLRKALIGTVLGLGRRLRRGWRGLRRTRRVAAER